MALLVVIGLSAAAVILLRESPWPWDPIHYVDVASSYLASGEIPLEHRALRWGLLLPLAWLFKAFGVSEMTYYLFPVLAAMLLALSVYVLARRVLRPWWASAAAILATVNPVVLSKSTHPLPDVAATALLTLGVAGILWLDQISDGHKLPLVIATGAVLGYAYALRESIVILAPVVLVCLVLTKTSLRHAFALLASALSLVGLEFLLMNHWFGSPTARLETIAIRNTRTGPIADVEAVARTELFQGSIWLSVTAWFRRWNAFRGLGVAPLVALAGCTFQWRSSPKAHQAFWRSLASWILIGWAVFVLMGLWRNNRGGFVFNLLQVRYWFVLVPPVAVATAGLLQWIAMRSVFLGRSEQTLDLRRIGVTATVGLCVILFVGSIGVGLQVIRGYTGMQELRSWLAEAGEEFDSLAASSEAGSVAELFTANAIGNSVWDGTVVESNGAPDADLYLISWEDKSPAELFVDGIHVDLARPPDSWEVEFVALSGRLAVLRPGAGDSTTSQRGPDQGPPFPQQLNASKAREEWVFENVSPQPLRFRIEYQGAPPLLRCKTSSDSSDEGVPPAYAHVGLAVVDVVTELEFFCPGSAGTSVGVHVFSRNPMPTVLETLTRIEKSDAYRRDDLPHAGIVNGGVTTSS